MPSLTSQIKSINNLIQQKNIKTISFDIDGTLYSMRKIQMRWWKTLLIHPIKALRFLYIRKNWEKRRQSKKMVVIDQKDIDFFQHFLFHLLSPNLIPPEIRQWLDVLRARGLTVIFFTDHGALEKIKALDLTGFVFNCLNETGELKPHLAISRQFIQKFKIDPNNHLHLGDRWTDESQAKLLGSHFSWLKPF